MIVLNVSHWQLAGGVTGAVVLVAAVSWLLLRKRPTEEEIERQRRQFLVQSGRLVDGMSLDVFEIEAKDGRIRTMLLYSYRIGGVDYQCSQDLTDIPGMLEPEQLRAGFPCSVRYQPGNPQNSIAVAENWSGLRMGLPVLPHFEDPEPVDLSHLRRSRR